MPSERLIQQGHQSDDPAVKRGVVNDNSALSHHIFQIAEAQGIRQVPADTLSNNINGVMQASEGLSDKRHGQATS